LPRGHARQGVEVRPSLVQDVCEPTPKYAQATSNPAILVFFTYSKSVCFDLVMLGRLYRAKGRRLTTRTRVFD
jgi:hypothetical protein